MRFSLSRFLARFFVALCLVGILYACRASSPQVNAPSSPTEQTAIAQTTSAQLPQAAQVLVDKSQGGLFSPPRGDVRFVVISDLNDAYGSTDYSREVDQGIALLPLWQPDMVLCSGDMVAGQSPTLTPDQLKAMWAAFDDHVAAPLRQAKIPFGFTIGNHDASAALGVKGNFLFQRERDVASDYWRDPAHNPGVKFIDQYDYPFFFTFEYQDIFFMAWDGSSNNIPPEKLAWVEKSLASEKAQSAKLRILLGHLPLYAVAVGRNEPAEVMQNADQLRSLLEKYKVHTYISGHHHAYYPAHRGGLQLLHMGILGSGPRPLVDFPKPPRKAITVMDVKFDAPEQTTYTTFDMKTLKQIKNEELPRFLLGHNGITLRRDVEWNALTAQEKAACVNRLGAKRCTA